MYQNDVVLVLICINLLFVKNVGSKPKKKHKDS